MTLTDQPYNVQGAEAPEPPDTADHEQVIHSAGDGYTEPRESWSVCTCGAHIWEWQQFYNETPAHEMTEAWEQHLRDVGDGL